MITRENKYAAGNYMEVDIVPLPEEVVNKLSGTSRKRKKNMTRPRQQLVNDTRSFKWMRLAINGNFFKGDYYFTLTYDNGELPTPDKVEEAKKDLSNFLRKVRTQYKKKQIELKYIWVMEYELDDEGEYMTRVHFHLVMNKGVDRDTLEDCWSRGRGKNRKMFGYVYARRVQPNGDFGLERLSGYFSKGKRWKKGKKIWNCSRNLERPQKLHPNDSKYSRRAIEKMFLSNDYGHEILEKKYPNYFITSIQFVDHEKKGKHMYLRMWKKERAG
ncbi:rolling circle replication-associated protein [Enterococcus wangshanyuanii]|uniref:Replication-associated protein ORF2/G2P domain-containing protein n=1 Tax=Enterococcus wangshanyuanii TaxID=2005703 RepID=A0ABQ1P7C7_9ENTE|nr:hypothetical protein [Enterococcus wangshanyuanii]GGC88236.1 hypothetical protein GCM10011573_17310 [Enterococcus wangshanyuanii]